MSRHRNVKKLNYDDEYDDYYGAYDEDDDFDLDDDDFAAKYLSSGIDLKLSEGNNSKQQQQQSQPQPPIEQTKIYPTKDNSIIGLNLETSATEASTSGEGRNIELSECSTSLNPPTVDNASDVESSPYTAPRKIDHDIQLTTISSDLTRLAIRHLDKHQWQLPLMEMDSKFRDRTYYKHYSDSYISSLHSKLGNFLSDTRLLSNPMRHHAQNEQDNYEKYSKMFKLLTDYYQSLGENFFSFATPSPDEEIVIGCRLGTKAKKPNQQKKPAAKDVQPTTRFEYSGKSAGQPKPKQQKDQDKSNVSNKPKQSPATSSGVDDSKLKDLTVEEDFTAEQLEKISAKYRETLKADSNRADSTKSSVNFAKLVSTSKSSPQSNAPGTSSSTVQVINKSGPAKKNKIAKAEQPPIKQLATLTEKRLSLKQRLKQNAQPSEQDWEAFRLRSIQASKEYSELMKGVRPRLNLVVVGHVDAGKSTLVGHLLFRLGQVSNKQMHRNEVDSQRSGKGSFKFAWALDETDEERARGVTIDIALTKFQTSQKDIVLLDAPGHVDFIPAVISGAAQADAALLVVDATRGEFETGFQAGGQTREHTLLVRSLGVKSLVVVVNKMDNVEWNWTRFKDITEQLKPFLKQVGFNLVDDVQFIPVSGLTGDNLVERRQDKLLKQSSHPQLENLSGLDTKRIPCLLEAIDNMKPPERSVDKPTRVCITDVFKGMSSGVFLGAKVISGKVEQKQKLLLLPPGELSEIKQVDVRDNCSQQSAFAGDIVTVTATGVDMSSYYRGCILCDPVIPCNVTNRFQARVVMFQNASTILIKGTPIEVHINGSYESGEVRKLISLLNRSSGELIQRKPRCITQNSSAIIQLKLSRVVCCELYESNKDLGRFMMRSLGKTIAAGLITKIKPAKVSKSGKTKMKSK